jgi:hypothetical protein
VRKDESFTGTDLVRIWANNLSIEEQRDVQVVITISHVLSKVAFTEKRKITILVLLLAQLSPQPWRTVAKFLIRFFNLADLEKAAEKFLADAERILEDTGLTLEDLRAISDDIEELE